MTYQEIKSFINTYIVTNGGGAITGARLNTVLNELADYKGFNAVVVTTLPAGSDATATVQEMTLLLGIPRGADGQNAINPFKGWFDSLDDLKDLFTASAGDSAYVKDASPATTWSIYVYDSTAATDNYWADSGTDADTSNVQTFASSQEVNEVHIVNDLTTGGTDDVLSAEQGKVLGGEIFTVESITENVPMTNIVSSLMLNSNGTFSSASSGYKIYYFTVSHDGTFTLKGTNTASSTCFVVGKLTNTSQITNGGSVDSVLYAGVANGQTANFSTSVTQGQILCFGLRYSTDASVRTLTYQKKSSRLDGLEDFEAEVGSLGTRVETLENEEDVVSCVDSANLHCSLDATISDTKPTDGSDWFGHSCNASATNTVIYELNNDYITTDLIPIDYTKIYQCNHSIKRLLAINASGKVVVVRGDITALADIDFSNETNASTIVGVIFMYLSRVVPYVVKFGEADKATYCEYLSMQDEYGNTVRRAPKILTSIGSSGLAYNLGGKVMLSSTQKEKYGVIDDLCATKVVQKLLGYDIANVVAWSGNTASNVFFKGRLAQYTLVNSVTLPHDGTTAAYNWNTNTIKAALTSNLNSINPTMIGNFYAILNGYRVVVNPASSGGTIRLVNQTEADVVIPAGSMLCVDYGVTGRRESGCVTAPVSNTTGLILQIGANGEGATAEEIYNYCELAIKASNCKWFVVLRRNTQGNLTLEQLQTQGDSDLNKAAYLLRSKYGNMFIDHMSYMTTRKALSDMGVTPTTSDEYPDEQGVNSNPLTATQIAHNVPCDMECIATGKVPSSFWQSAYRNIPATDDNSGDTVQDINSGHFNALGLECLGKYIFDMVKRLNLSI